MTTKENVQVWDVLVRVFHWSLVACFSIAYLTGEEESALHVYSGYAVLGLIVLRVVWGFVGSKYARFGDFLYSPAEVIGYLRGLASGQPKHYPGHNPAGGWMIIILLAGLFVVTMSGLKVYGLEGHGPLAESAPRIALIEEAYADSDEAQEGHEAAAENSAEEEFWEEVHEVSSNLMVFFVGLHILGVVVSSRLHKENLVKAMITGKKEKQV